MDALPVIAAIRFAQGRRPNDPVPADPAAWLESQLAPGLPGPVLPADLPATLPAIFAAQLEDVASRRAGMGQPNQIRIRQEDAVAALTLAIGGQQGFRERLVAFWANHLAVVRLRVPYFAGIYTRDVIRAHVTGRFENMLLAMAQHPAMLSYLDNNGSIGPNSRAGLRRQRSGLNENLAREILELHTVTPAAGYNQADVTAFARILTGWSYAGAREPFGFVFRPPAHEPGPKTVMGRIYPEGVEGGVMLLTWLARHEKTHRHLATKLVRHFVADNPPPAAVDRIFGVLRDTQGDLGAASRALIALPEAWSTPLSKVRSPQDYVISVLRAVEAPADTSDRALGAMQFLGQPWWGPPAPIGFPDTAAAWAAPELMVRRIDWSNSLAGRGAGRDTGDVAATVLGPLCRPDTLRATARAGSAREALTLLLTSPEFQRR